MILGRLFTALFEAGVVVVATSNVAPDDLYKDGLNRALFLPFIALLRERLDIVELDARDRLPAGKARSRAGLLHAAWAQGRRRARRRFLRADRPASAASQSRSSFSAVVLDVPQAAGGVARFDFDGLCRRPLGSADYLEIAEQASTPCSSTASLSSYRGRTQRGQALHHTCRRALRHAGQARRVGGGRAGGAVCRLRTAQKRSNSRVRARAFRDALGGLPRSAARPRANRCRAISADIAET